MLAERGFHGASVEDVCEPAGFIPGAFHPNCSSKDELVLALYESTAQWLPRDLAVISDR